MCETIWHIEMFLNNQKFQNLIYCPFLEEIQKDENLWCWYIKHINACIAFH